MYIAWCKLFFYVKFMRSIVNFSCLVYNKPTR